MIAEKLRKAVLQAAIQGKLLSLENVECKTVYFDNQEFEIPANWQCVKIGELGSFQRGKGINRSQIVKKGFPAVRYGELYTTYDLFIDEVVSFVPANIHSKSYKINYGDILFTLTGETDIDIAKSVSYLCDEPASFGGDLAAWMNHNQDPKYLSYALSSPFLISQKAKSATGNIIVHSSVKKISNMMIILPPLEEQKRIVKRLEVVLAEIDKLEQDEKALKDLEDKIPEKLKNAIIQAAIQGKLVDNSTRESAFTELDEKTQTLYMNNKDKYKLPFDIPNSWILMPIFQRYEFVKTGVSNFEGEKSYFSTGSIKEEFKPEGTYTFENRPSRANRLVLKGDIIEAKMSNTIKTTIVNEELDNQLVSTGFFQIRINSEITTKYVYYFLQSPYFTNIKNELSSGTTQKAINDANLSKIIIPIPPLEEQKRIVEKLDKLFSIDLLNI